MGDTLNPVDNLEATTGIRFDATASGNPLGYNGNVGYNVIWNVDDKEYYTKGDNHTVYNNIGWDDNSNGCTVCVPCKAFGVPMNFYSTVTRNGASKLDCGGGLVENNYESQDIKEQMRDTDNYDFRPVEGGGLWSSDGEIIGAYTEPSTPIYWIPGRKLYKTSFPIPQDGSTVSAESRSDVICQTGYQAEEHSFYFGESYEEVDSAVEPYMTLNGDENVFPMPTALSPGKIYYWRVDASRGDYVYKGDIWSFETI